MTEFTDKFMAFYILNQKIEDLRHEINQAFTYTTTNTSTRDYRQPHVMTLSNVEQYIKEAYRSTHAFLRRLESEAKHYGNKIYY